jgi:hypothetical protein
MKEDMTDADLIRFRLLPYHITADNRGAAFDFGKREEQTDQTEHDQRMSRYVSGLITMEEYHRAVYYVLVDIKQGWSRDETSCLQIIIIRTINS